MFTRSCQQDRERLTIIVVQQVLACVVTCAYIYCTDCHMTSHMVKWLQNLPQSLSLAFKLTVNQMHKHTGLNLTTCTCTCIRQLHTTIHHNYHFTSRHMTSHKCHMTSHNCHMTSHNCHMWPPTWNCNGLLPWLSTVMRMCPCQWQTITWKAGIFVWTG